MVLSFNNSNILSFCMETPGSYFDWEQTFHKKKAKKIQKPENIKLINSIELQHDFFKSYMKLWKSRNLVEAKSREPKI